MEVVGERGVMSCEAEALEGVLHENVATIVAGEKRNHSTVQIHDFNITRGEKDNFLYPPICPCN